MRFGYARVSSEEQSLDLQCDALLNAGCDRIFHEKESGGKADRPELLSLLERIAPGDTVVVWRLDRLGRSLLHLIATVERLEAQGVGFQSITEAIDTTTSGGKLIFHIFAALAEFERTLIRERTCAGLAAARARGRNGGRPPALTTAEQARLPREPGQNVTALCAQLGISRATYYRVRRLNLCEKTPEEQNHPFPG